MNCPNCAALMTLIPDRHYFYCEYCGAFHFPIGPEDGIGTLGPSPEDLLCPVCRNPLRLVVLDNHFRGHQCTTCLGLLLGRTGFRDAILGRRARAASPADAPRPLNRAELDRRLLCPRCAIPMNTHPYYGPGNIVIDSCDRCNHIWLDYGELTRSVNAPGTDRGADHRPPRPGPLTTVDDHDDDDAWRPGHRVDLLDLLDLFF